MKPTSYSSRTETPVALPAQPTPQRTADAEPGPESRELRGTSVSSLKLEPPKVFVVLPAYNEEQALPQLLARIGTTFQALANDYEIVIVDDGSSDNTQSIARDFSLQLPIHLVVHPVNAGLGATIRDGLLAAARLANSNDIIVALDCDNTHPPELIPRMIGLVNEGHDLVIASRFQRGSRTLGVPWNRVVLSYGARFLFRVMFPVKGVRDYTCGFRAYRASVVKEAFDEFGDRFVSESGFSSMVDILLKLRSKQLLICEVPLLLRYDQKGNESKMKVLRTIFRTFALMGRRRLGRMN
jgi:dolichol-phosphate mannosyltransferase